MKVAASELGSSMGFVFCSMGIEHILLRNTQLVKVQLSESHCFKRFVFLVFGK